MEAVAALRGTPVTVLASGDPFLHGVGVTLARRIEPSRNARDSAPSAFSLAAARLGWALQDTVCLSLHGHPVSLIRPHLHPGTRILALTSDETGPAALAALLTDTGFGHSRLTVMEALGGARERITRSEARSYSLPDCDPLNLCAVEVVAGQGAAVLSLAPGLDDGLFEHDGQITKREVRALTLSALRPRARRAADRYRRRSGSVAIEWMLADVSLKAIAVEAVPERASRIRRNADRGSAFLLFAWSRERRRRRWPGSPHRIRSFSAAAAASRA